LATLDIEPPEALWPETKGQAASLARVRGHPCTVRAVTGGRGSLGRAKYGHGAGQRPDGGDEDQGVMVTDRWEPRWEPRG
jgi:hypothetical protein